MAKLIKLFRKIQKPLFIMAALVAAIVFFYSLAFSTDLYNLSFFMDLDGLGRYYVEGSRIYLEAQTFNKLLFNLAIILILITISLFVYFGQSRRIYYISNIITISLYCAYCFMLAGLIIIKVIEIKDKFLNGVDFETYLKFTQRLGVENKYTTSTFWLDMGFVVSGILIFISLLMLINMFLRIYAIRSEQKQKTLKEQEAAKDGGLDKETVNV